MKRLQLAPYPGEILLFRDPEEFGRTYRKMVGGPCPLDAYGFCTRLFKKGYADTYLVYARRNAATLAHELSHVILQVFEHVGIHPKEGNGEPFCYLLSHLMDEATRK